MKGNTLQAADVTGLLDGMFKEEEVQTVIKELRMHVGVTPENFGQVALRLIMKGGTTDEEKSEWRMKGLGFAEAVFLQRPTGFGSGSEEERKYVKQSIAAARTMVETAGEEKVYDGILRSDSEYSKQFSRIMERIRNTDATMVFSEHDVAVHDRQKAKTSAEAEAQKEADEARVEVLKAEIAK